MAGESKVRLPPSHHGRNSPRLAPALPIAARSLQVFRGGNHGHRFGHPAGKTSALLYLTDGNDAPGGPMLFRRDPSGPAPGNARGGGRANAVRSTVVGGIGAGCLSFRRAVR